MKVCPRSGQNLDLSEFAVDNAKQSGHKSICKECDRVKARAYYAEHREQVIARVTARRGQPDRWRGRRSSGRRRTRYSSARAGP